MFPWKEVPTGPNIFERPYRNAWLKPKTKREKKSEKLSLPAARHGLVRQIKKKAAKAKK
jgi:hypothetical protein